MGKLEKVPGVGAYGGPAGGWGALQAVARALRAQMALNRETRALRRVNQPQGFDCPGCAWPDPRHASSFEFCENGAKAVAWEATRKRADARLLRRAYRFRAVELDRLRARRRGPSDASDDLRRGERPLSSRSPGRTRSRASAQSCASCPIRTWRSSTPRAAPRTKRRSCTSCSCASSAPTISPTAPTCATRRPASACRIRSASAKAR